MTLTLHLALMVLALALFLAAGFNAPSRFNLVALGLAAWVASTFIR